MNIFRIRNKETGEFFRGESLWISLWSAEDMLESYSHLKNYEEWRSQWEIVEYELREVSSGS